MRIHGMAVKDLSSKEKGEEEGGRDLKQALRTSRVSVTAQVAGGRHHFI